MARRRRTSLSSEIGQFAKFFVKPSKREKELRRLAKKRRAEIEKARVRILKARRKQEARDAKAERKFKAGVARKVAKIRKRTRIEHN